MKTIIAPITDYPITSEQAKAHLRVTSSAEDELIRALIWAATDYAERYTGILLARRDVFEYFDCWPVGDCGDCFELSITPFVEIRTFTYIPEGQTGMETWDGQNYVVDNKGVQCKIVLAEGIDFPSLAILPNAIEIRYEAGFTADFVPNTIKQAMLLMIGFWYENREDIPVNETRNYRIRSAEALLSMHRQISF